METLHAEWYGGFLLFALTSVWVLTRVLNFPGALAVAGLKFGFLFAYVHALGAYYIREDDLSYFRGAAMLIDEGWSTTGLLFTDEGLARLFSAGEGLHFIYYLWNLWAIRCFGESYFSPVLVNVFLSVLTGVILYHWARQMLFTAFYARGLCVLFLLHWELLPWSSILNIKDLLVLFLETVCLYALWRFFTLGERRWHFLIVASATVLVLSFLRFYVAVLVMIAFAGWYLASARVTAKNLLVLALAVVALVPQMALLLSIDLPPASLSSVASGVFRFLLTPRPWAVDEGYGFLVVPAIVHWLLLPFALGALLSLWHHRHARLLIVFSGLMLMAYGWVDELQGPRHRVQMLFALAWIQWHAVYMLLAGSFTFLHKRPKYHGEPLRVGLPASPPRP